MKHLNSIYMRSRESLPKIFEACRDAHSVAQLHSLLIRTGLLAAPDCFFATRLTASYARIAHLESARKVFDEIPHPNTFLWNAILRAHSRAHQWPETLSLFHRMYRSSPPHHRPDAFTLPIALKACAALSALGTGKAVHGLFVKTHRASSDMFVGAALVEMYAKFGDMGYALRVFEGFPEPDVVLRTSMVSGYQQNGEADMAVSFFCQMFVGKSVTPDPVTLVSVVSALGLLGDLRSGKSCHGFVIRMGIESDLSLMNSILNLYAKLGVVGMAKRLFEVMPRRDVITWSCMVACYAQNGSPIEALNVYRRMNDVGLEPNSVTLISALQACALALVLEEGKRVHELVLQKGFESELAVSTALIDMYMKCSSYSEAMDIFNRMPKKDAVSWAAIIGGYAQNGLPDESLRVFKGMLLDGSIPDAVIMVKVLKACCQLGIQHQAVCLHGYLVTNGFENKVFVGAALVDLYSKCGNLDSAVRVFGSMDEKDVVLWSSMIAGYGIHGLGSRAIATFEHMIKSSVKPNNVTFVSILSACSHAGLVEEGRRIFDSMNHVYGVVPDSEHYGIMVDLLGRSGELHEAMMLIERMPKPVGPDVWCALLAGCRIHQNIEMGELVAKNLLELQPNHAGYYNLLSNMYAFDGKWDNVTEVRTVMEERGLRKIPGYSAVEVGSEVHTFLAGDRLQEWGRIYELLKELAVKMGEEGYVPLEEEGLVDCQIEECLVEACL
ncbi:putative pentatricopeptide repeat-containing protein At3g01580 [Phoenix dactylifera]|uniref:Pentatricopeptide repeat-containing protein At3g01580 n=1 Tax=Phoenix dactylifera TaxID=42345 RepID=A0A8B8J616_PHODC|nr:putative pentatricopeptide repeat-containing protein At3g01580 [Phoenix dactylifera]XP_026661517.2 putative pentatricopeptide repeat-containing protein At3g01580 [Phoenix dactylifera]XP_026661518.2 putative pentatricopeptide repeat-containing protein At3g01580 [Phoenix dactylifera]XP_026661519.2 putative pentatricopeptide repeat-containing protein At3g01580 [Phoenix dactylifera]